MTVADLNRWLADKADTASVVLQLEPGKAVILDARFLSAEPTRLCDQRSAERSK